MDEKNNKYCNILLLLLLAQFCTQSLNFILKVYLGLDSSMFTMLYYGVVLLYALYVSITYNTRNHLANKLLWYVLILLCFALSYFLFEDTRKYYSNTYFLIIILIVLPICVFAITEISDIKAIVPLSSRYCVFATVLFTYNIFFMNYADSGNYMEFSYPFLPFCVLSYCNIKNNRTAISVITFILGCVDLLIFGSRATVIFVILAVFVYEIANINKHDVKYALGIFALLILFIVIVLSWGYIEKMAIVFADKYNSRFLMKIFKGELFQSEGRKYLYTKAREEISSIGLTAYGFFGDRNLLGGVYSHNIIYEYLLSTGWIVSILSLLLVFSGIARMKRNRIDRKSVVVLLMMFISLFCKLFVSGSFVETPNFYIFCALFVAASKIRKNHEDIQYE